MSTISIEYDDQYISVKIIRCYETVEMLYIDKDTPFEDIGQQLYELLDEAGGSFDVSLENV